MMRKRMIFMIIALVIVFGGLIAYNFIKSLLMKRYFAQYEPPAVSVSAVTASQRDWKPRIPAVGNFKAINGVEVNSEAAGIVVKIHFESGQMVQKSAPLIDIDDSVDQANLKFNQSELALREINFKRQSDLFKRGATPSSSLDEATAGLRQAEANVEKTQMLIRQKHITAPFTGKLGIRKTNLGQYITPGQTSIVTLQSTDPLYLEFYLPEQLFKRLHLNQLIQFSVEQNPGLLFEGRITAINAKVDTNTHNIQVQATVPNCPAILINDLSGSTANLYSIKKQASSDKTIISCDTALNTKNNITQFNFIPGMFAAIEVDQPPIPHVIVLPTTAISYSLYGNSVFVIEKRKDNPTHLEVKRVFVSTGDEQGNYVVINKGIQAGQQIVNSGELKLQNSTRVTINNEVQLKDISNPDELGQ